MSERARAPGDHIPLALNVLFHVTWIAVLLFMYTCTDALPVSPTAHHVLEFFLDCLG